MSDASASDGAAGGVRKKSVDFQDAVFTPDGGSETVGGEVVVDKLAGTLTGGQVFSLDTTGGRKVPGSGAK